jgi:hypothetical protein
MAAVMEPGGFESYGKQGSAPAQSFFRSESRGPNTFRVLMIMGTRRPILRRWPKKLRRLYGGSSRSGVGGRPGGTGGRPPRFAHARLLPSRRRVCV